MFNSITLAHSGINNATPPEDIVGSSSLNIGDGTEQVCISFSGDSKKLVCSIQYLWLILVSSMQLLLKTLLVVAH